MSLQRSTTASSSSTGTSTQSAPATPHGGHGAAHKDDIYIDDDAAEGSGHGGVSIIKCYEGDEAT